MRETTVVNEDVLSVDFSVRVVDPGGDGPPSSRIGLFFGKRRSENVSVGGPSSAQRGTHAVEPCSQQQLGRSQGTSREHQSLGRNRSGAYALLDPLETDPPLAGLNTPPLFTSGNPQSSIHSPSRTAVPCPYLLPEVAQLLEESLHFSRK